MRRRLRLFVRGVGGYGILLRDIVHDLFTGGLSSRELIRQIVHMGVNSTPIIILTALFTGMVLALQTAYGLERFGAKNYVGNVAGLGMVRELGPVLTALMLCGRVGAGIAAEIASMVVTEQVDAIRALGANPISKLVTPKVVASIIVLPLLVVIADVIGLYGGLIVSVYELNVSAHSYYRSVLYTIVIKDVMDGLIKSSLFGFLLASIACFRGLHTKGGSEGVGLATTSAVVTASIVIFIANFFITKLLIAF